MNTVKKLHCNICRHETNHEEVATHERSYTEDVEHGGRVVGRWWEEWIYRFMICRGCDAATIEEAYTCQGMHEIDGEQVYSFKYYPRRTNGLERQPKKYQHIEERLNATYLELIKAYQNGLNIVCAMGVRALLEGICVQEGVDDKASWGLKGKLEKLGSSSNIPKNIIQGLETIKFVGDDAAHRLMSISKNQLDISLDLLEALLNHLYEAKFELLSKAELAQQAHNKRFHEDT